MNRCINEVMITMDSAKQLMLGIVLLLPIIALIISVALIIVGKKRNRSIKSYILTGIISLVLTALPIIYLIKDEEGLGFVFIVILECYALSVLIPWTVFIFATVFIVKKAKNNPFTQKTVISVILILLMLLLVCFGTFSGLFLDSMNTIMGGPQLK